MICEHPACTGNHNDRKYDTLCPRSRADKNATHRRDYWENHQRHLDRMAQYRTTAASMLAQARYERTHRRGGRDETTLAD